MLQNAYFLAKIEADTAENEQHFAEILPTDALQLLSLFGGHVTAQLPRMVRLRQLATLELEGPGGGDDRSVKIKSQEAAKIMKMKWLVLFCIEADFCK